MTLVINWLWQRQPRAFAIFYSHSFLLFQRQEPPSNIFIGSTILFMMYSILFLLSLLPFCRKNVVVGRRFVTDCATLTSVGNLERRWVSEQEWILLVRGFSLVVCFWGACGKLKGLSTRSGTGNTYVVVVCRDVMCYVRFGLESWPFDVRQTFYVFLAAYLQYKL